MPSTENEAPVKRFKRYALFGEFGIDGGGCDEGRALLIRVFEFEFAANLDSRPAPDQVRPASRTVYSFTDSQAVVEVPVWPQPRIVTVTNGAPKSGSGYVTVGAVGPQGLTSYPNKSR
jgi:hypothetical protein